MKWLPFFRNQSIFHQSETPLDPEDIKLRFRRWMVIFSFLVALVIISIPIFKYRSPAFIALANARSVVELIIDARKLAGQTRSDTGIRLIGQGRWEQFALASDADCMLNKKEANPRRSLVQTRTAWRILFLPKYAGDGIGRDVQFICFNPQHGVVVDGEPIADGWLYFLVSPKEDVESKEMNRSYQIVLSQHGDKIEVQPVL